MPCKKLTVERAFSDPNLSGPVPIRQRFSLDGKQITYLCPKDENDEILDLWAYDVVAGQHRPLVRTEQLVAPEAIELSEQERAHRERMRIRQTGIVDYQWAESGDRLLFPLSGALYVYTLDADPGQHVRCAIPAAGSPVYDPKFSPDGETIAFVRDGNLHVVDVASSAVRALTADGSGTVQNGVAEFVAQEEMDRHTGYWWSPDGGAIAYTQIDEAPVPLVQRPAYHRDRVEVIEQRYPAAGEANVLVRVGVSVAPVTDWRLYDTHCRALHGPSAREHSGVRGQLGPKAYRELERQAAARARHGRRQCAVPTQRAAHGRAAKGEHPL